MSRKGIAERLQLARRSKERLSYDWWREVYIQDVSELLPQARVLEEGERENEDLRRDIIDAERQLTDALRRGETAEANVVELEREVERAIQNILSDFDKESAVRLMAGRIDELKRENEALRAGRDAARGQRDVSEKRSAELQRVLSELSARIHLQHMNTDLPWLETWEELANSVLGDDG